MERKEKIKLLSDIADGVKSIHDLRMSKCFMLSLGKLTEWTFPESGFSLAEITVDEFCAKYVPGKDELLVISHTAFNLPPEYNDRDPSGDVLKQIIKKAPELKNEDFRAFIIEARDLKNTDFYKSIE